MKEVTEWRRHSRRTFVATSAGVVLAGCLGGNDDDSGDGGSDGDGGMDDSGDGGGTESEDSNSESGGEDGDSGDGSEDGGTDGGGTDDTDGETGGDDEEGGSGGGDTGDDSQQTVVNELGGIEVTSHSGEVADDMYAVTFTIENVGEETPDIDEYTFRIRLFDEDGTDLTAVGSLVYGAEGDLAPGEKKEIRIENPVEEEANDDTPPERVARYQIEIKCGAFPEEPYCEE